MNLTKRVWKLPTSTQLRVTWHTYPLNMIKVKVNLLQANKGLEGE
jgi:hypothetical protein